METQTIKITDMTKNPYYVPTREEWQSMAKGDYYPYCCNECGCLIRPGHARRDTDIKYNDKKDVEFVGYVYFHKGTCWLEHNLNYSHDGYGNPIPDDELEAYKQKVRMIIASHDLVWAKSSETDE